MDLLDNGSFFYALENLSIKNSDEVSLAVSLKIRESHNQTKLKSGNRYILSLTRKEIDCFYIVIVEKIINFGYQEIVENVETKPLEHREESIDNFKVMLALGNGILEKLDASLEDEV